MSNDEPGLAEIAALLDTTDMSREDKAYVLNGLWTQSEIAEIRSSKQYAAYAKWHREVLQKLHAAGINVKDPAHSRSPDGVLATSICARMLEWEMTRPSRSMRRKKRK